MGKIDDLYNSNYDVYEGNQKIREVRGFDLSKAAVQLPMALGLAAVVAIFIFNIFLYGVTFYILPALMLLLPLKTWMEIFGETKGLLRIYSIGRKLMWLFLPLFLLSFIQIKNFYYFGLESKTIGDGKLFYFLREVFSIFFPYLHFAIYHINGFMEALGRKYNAFLTLAPIALMYTTYMIFQLLLIVSFGALSGRFLVIPTLVG